MCFLPSASGKISPQSATFEFPTLDSSLTVTAEENDTIQIPFTIAECKHLGANFKIEISRDDAVTSSCIIRVRGKECAPYKHCTCTEDGVYQLKKTVSRTDRGKWTWRTGEEAIVGDVTVTVNVTYPVRLTKFSLTSHGSELQAPANQGDTITVHCDYEEGNPPLLPTIFDRYGVMLPTHKDNHGTRMTYTYDVSCDDAGELRCEAPGASVNKTATLLVRCPPQFVTGQNQTVSVENDKAVITFDIRTQTDKMIGCNLTHSEETEKKIDCLGSINITGTPPDLVLTVRLDNVRKQDEGQWQLRVTNNVGNESVEFWLEATDTGPSTHGVTTYKPQGSGKRTTNEGMKPRSVLAIGLGVMFAVILVVIGITICFVRKRSSGAKRRRLESPATQRADIHIDNQHRQQDVVINHAADGSAERHVIPEGQQDGACGKSASVRGKAGWEGMEGTSRKSAREPGDGSDTYVNVPTLKKKKKTAHPEETTGNAEGAAAPSCSFESNDYVAVKDIQKRKRQAQSLAEGTARNASDEDDEEKDGDGEGLTYVQLDFSGKRARSVTIQPLPRTDYAEVNFRADPPPNPEDTDQ